MTQGKDEEEKISTTQDKKKNDDHGHAAEEARGRKGAAIWGEERRGKTQGGVTERLSLPKKKGQQKNNRKRVGHSGQTGITPERYNKCRKK